jgi:8-oxo-dGTP diphosphatase
MTPSEPRADWITRYRETASRFAKPSVTVDLVVCTVRDEVLEVLLVQRGAPPFQGAWALPGGFVRVGDTFEDQGESLEAAARRELHEETGLHLENAWLEQVGAFGAPHRDPRMRIISIAYTALLRPALAERVKAGSDAADARWFPIAALPDLAFDHEAILAAAHQHLRNRLDVSAIAFELVSEAFTVADLRAVWSAILGETQDPGNFRRRFRRMCTDGLIELSGGVRPTSTKPAKLYRFGGDPAQIG